MNRAAHMSFVMFLGMATVLASLTGCGGSQADERQSAEQLVQQLWDRCFEAEPPPRSVSALEIGSRLRTMGRRSLPALKAAKNFRIPSHDPDVVKAYMMFQFHIDYSIKEINAAK